jgi:hypothetical protein
MVTGVSSGGKPHEYQPPALATLKEWADKLEEWSKQYPDAAQRSPIFERLREELDNYIRGGRGYMEPSQVMQDLKEKIFSTINGDDVYMRSGLDSAEPVQELAKIFGIKLDQPSPMDKLMFEFEHGAKSMPSDWLLEQLKGKILDLGSNGSIDKLTEWAKTVMPNASPAAKEVFHQLLGI